MRAEQEIFEELALLCASPGYAHALAFLCFRDNIVRYQGEMTAEDMKNMFSPERLVRTEISTLLGLLIKTEIDYTLPDSATTRRYISRTEELLEELHKAMLSSVLGGLTLQEAAEKGINPFSQGNALREAIFYGGETGYSFQYRDLSLKKYAADNGWLTLHKGFSIQSARNVIASLATLHAEKLTDVMNQMTRSHPSKWSLLPGFSFTAQELSEFARIDKQVVENVLAAFALAPGETNSGFRSLHDFNVANATPLLRHGESFILFQEYSIAEALYDSPFYWMCGDAAYLSTAMSHRGKFVEEFSRERLERVFGSASVYRNVDIYESKRTKVGEIDVLVLFGNRAIVLQAKSKRLTLEARKGNDQQLKDDFKKSVQESYDQARECAEFFSKPSLRFIDANSKELSIPKRMKTIYIFCVVSDNYPALSFQARQFLTVRTTDVIRAPFVMDIFTLDVMTEMLESPLYFLSYVDKRTGYADRIVASHELVLLSQHLKRNLWFEDKYQMILLEDDISADLDVAMSVRRDNVPGKRTPDGILTRIVNTSVGRILKEIEARPEPATLDLGFMLLTLGENAVVKLSKAIDLITSRARLDRKGHDVSVPLDEAGSGLTIHCNDEPMPSSGPRLMGHCRLRKYVLKVKEWHGLCLLPKDGTLRFGVSLNYEWEHDPEMDAFASRLRKPVPFEDIFPRWNHKIGRNDPCPCTSGLKYKKCHGK